MARTRNTTQRRLVPCGCSQCGGFKLISQDEERRHRKRDQKQAARRALEELSQQGHQGSNLALGGSQALPLPSSPPHTAHSSTQPGGGSPPTAQPGTTTTPPVPHIPFGEVDFLPAISDSPTNCSPTPEDATTIGARPSHSSAADMAEIIGDDDWEVADVDDEDMEADEPSQPMIWASAWQPTSSMPAIQSHAGHSTVTPSPPIALHVPLSKEVENSPDPFVSKDTASTQSLPPSFASVHPQQGVYLLYMLVSWLHLQFHLPFRACNALVNVVLLIISSFGAVVSPAPLTTLPRIMSRIDVEPHFTILPACPNCLEVYPSSSETPPQCTVCQAPIFKSANASLPLPRIAPAVRQPKVKFPHKSIQSQLSDILNVPGVEAELDAWRQRERQPGQLNDIFDGAIPKQLPCPDGSLFFRNLPGDERGPGGELRIGLTLGLDWFSYLRSQIAPSHSSCPISFSVANLPPHRRYRTSNLLLVGIMPGPKEQNPDQCQRFLRIYVNELLRLWQEGFTATTPASPGGRRVRVILICICCDKPAAHKVGGFGSHSHTIFCTRCMIKQAQKATPHAFQDGAFPRRTDEEHRRLGSAYTTKPGGFCCAGSRGCAEETWTLETLAETIRFRLANDPNFNVQVPAAKRSTSGSNQALLIARLYHRGRHEIPSR